MRSASCTSGSPRRELRLPAGDDDRHGRAHGAGFPHLRWGGVRRVSKTETSFQSGVSSRYMSAVAESHRGDFTANPRVLVLAAMAAVIGVISAFVALGLARLISFFTNVFYYGQFSARELASPAGHHLGAWSVLIPVAGGLIIGLMARYGSEKIRGHGIPEALE